MISAAELNNKDAQFKLSEMYLNGEGIEKDYEEGTKWFTRYNMSKGEEHNDEIHLIPRVSHVRVWTVESKAENHHFNQKFKQEDKTQDIVQFVKYSLFFAAWEFEWILNS